MEMTALPPRANHTEVTVEERGQPFPSGANFSDIRASDSEFTRDEEFFEEFSYKDLDALKELNCSMARKKEIR